jgi:hypothetical protein
MPLKKSSNTVTTDSGYQTAVSNGFAGTPTQFIQLLSGAVKISFGINPPENPQENDIWAFPAQNTV